MGGKWVQFCSCICMGGKCVLFFLVRLTLRKHSQSPSAAAERRAVRALVQEAVPPMASSTYRPVDGGARECSASTSLWGGSVTTSSLGGSVALAAVFAGGGTILVWAPPAPPSLLRAIWRISRVGSAAPGAVTKSTGLTTVTDPFDGSFVAFPATLSRECDGSRESTPSSAATNAPRAAYSRSGRNA